MSDATTLRQLGIEAIKNAFSYETLSERHGFETVAAATQPDSQPDTAASN